MAGDLIGLIVSLIVAILSGISVWRQTRRYCPKWRFKSARKDYRRAERNVHAIFRDAHRKMTRIKRVPSERYEPDLGDWDNWLR